MLPILNLNTFGLLHYYEDRDDGLHHVIRSLNGDSNFLNQISNETGLVRDSNLWGDLPSVSIKKDAFSHADADALKRIFPDVKMSNMEDSWATYDAKTAIIDRGAHIRRRRDWREDSYNYFNENIGIDAYKIPPVSKGVSALHLKVTEDLVGYIKPEEIELRHPGLIARIDRAIDLLNDGVVNDDTMPLWRLFFDYERSALSMDNLDEPLWSAFFKRIDHFIELNMHPGARRAYRINAPRPEIDELLKSEDRVEATLARNRAGFLLDTNNAEFFGSTQKELDGFSAEIERISSKGLIEISRSPVANISSLAYIQDLPIGTRVRLFERLESATAANDFKRTQVKAVVDDVLLKSKKEAGLSQFQVATEISNAITRITQIAELRANQSIFVIANSVDISIIGAKKELLSFCDVVKTREDRLFRVLESTLAHGLRHADVDKQKETLERVIQAYIDLSLMPRDQAAKDSARKLLADIDDKAIFYDDVVKQIGFAMNAADAINSALTAYSETKNNALNEQIRIDQAASRSSLVAIKPADDLDTDDALSKQVVHEDVGQKIGGARKDLYNHISSAVVNQLTFGEQLQYVTKARVWPRPDYAGMIENGVSPADVLFFKRLRDAVEPQAQELTSGWRSNSKLAPAAKSQHDFYRWTLSVDFLKNTIGNIQNQVDADNAVPAICKFLQEYIAYSDGTSSKHIDNGDALGNSFKKKFPSYRIEIDHYRHRSNYANYSAGYIKGKLGIKDKPAQGDSNNDVDKASLDGEVTDEQPAEKAVAPYPPHLEKLVRTGKDWRDGVDVTGDDLLKTFGFRGIEYGNWVSNNERQVVLNHAFDAFMDLAYVIGLPKESLSMISMNGSLALGFGSRGSGGRAVAHYEPLRDVINITKIKGAGSLAHEWLHAYDAYMGRITGFATPSVMLFSEVISLANNVPEIRDDSVLRMAKALTDTLLAAKQKPRTPEDIQRDIDNAYTKAAGHLGSWAQGVAYNYQTSNAAPGQRPVYPSIHKELVIDILKESTKPGSARGVGSAKALVAKLAAMQIAVAQGTYGDASYERQHQKLEQQMPTYMSQKCLKQANIGDNWLLSELERSKSASVPSDTDFLKDAQKLDGKSKKYWQSSCELLARSFSVAVYDKLKEDGMQSDYLVRGAERNEFASKKYKGTPNPEGAERDALNACYDELFLSIFHHAKIAIDKSNEDGPSM